MKKYPSVSLIITTYNRKEALELVLMSALKQSVPPHEILIADDGSREDTADLIREYQRKNTIPIVHCWQEDLGFRAAAARNLAIAKARYEYVVMIDGDIIMSHHFIKTHLKHAAPNRFLQGSRVMLGEELTKRAEKEKIIRFGFFASDIRSRFNALYIPFLSQLFSFDLTDLTRIRSCNQSYWMSDLKEINGFNEDFVGWGREDTEFMVRMLNSGKQCVKIRLEGFGYHLHHPISSRAMEQRNQEILDEAIASKSTRCLNGLDKHFQENS